MSSAAVHRGDAQIGEQCLSLSPSTWRKRVLCGCPAWMGRCPECRTTQQPVICTCLPQNHAHGKRVTFGARRAAQQHLRRLQEGNAQRATVWRRDLLCSALRCCAALRGHHSVAGQPVQMYELLAGAAPAGALQPAGYSAADRRHASSTAPARLLALRLNQPAAHLPLGVDVVQCRCHVAAAIKHAAELEIRYLQGSCKGACSVAMLQPGPWALGVCPHAAAGHHDSCGTAQQPHNPAALVP